MAIDPGITYSRCESVPVVLPWDVPKHRRERESAGLRGYGMRDDSILAEPAEQSIMAQAARKRLSLACQSDRTGPYHAVQPVEPGRRAPEPVPCTLFRLLGRDPQFGGPHDRRRDALLHSNGSGTHRSPTLGALDALERASCIRRREGRSRGDSSTRVGGDNIRSPCHCGYRTSADRRQTCSRFDPLCD